MTVANANEMCVFSTSSDSETAAAATAAAGGGMLSMYYTRLAAASSYRKQCSHFANTKRVLALAQAGKKLGVWCGGWFLASVPSEIASISFIFDPYDG